MGHDVLPGVEASSPLNWPALLGHLLLSAPEYSMPGDGKVRGTGPQEGRWGEPGEQEGPLDLATSVLGPTITTKGF